MKNKVGTLPLLNQELHFSTEPVIDEDIQDFCKNCIRYHSFVSLFDRKQLFNSLKEVCKTPTGRIAFRATMYNIKEQQKLNPHYKLELDIRSSHKKRTLGTVSKENTNCIQIHSGTLNDTINKATKGISSASYIPTEIERQNAYHFLLGNVFLHEAMHVRYFQDNEIKNNNYISTQLNDSVTQALSKQLAVESNMKIIHNFAHVSKKEFESYCKGVDFDLKTGTFDEKKAYQYSILMQQRLAQDFASSIEMAPYTNATGINSRFQYIKNDIILNDIYKILDKDKSKYLSNLLYQTHNIHLPFNTTDRFTKGTTLEKQAKIIQQKLSPKERGVLGGACLRNENLKRSDFESDETFKIAHHYQTSLNDIQEKLDQLAEKATLIDAEPDRKDTLKETTKIKKYLKKTYNITIPTYNKYGHRITQNNHIEPAPSPHLNDPSPSSINDTLAQNAQKCITQDDNTPAPFVQKSINRSC